MTSFLFQAHPVTMVYAGPIFWELKHARQICGVSRLPAQIACGPGALRWPEDGPFNGPVPRERWGKSACAIIGCFNGSAEDGKKAFAPCRKDCHPPSSTGRVPCRFRRCRGCSTPFPKGLQWYWKGDFVKELSDEAIEVHIARRRKRRANCRLMHLYPIDGAVRQLARATPPGMPRGDLVDGDSLKLFLGERDAPSIEEIETGISTLLESDDLPASIEHLVCGPVWALKEIGERERALHVHDELVVPAFGDKSGRRSADCPERSWRSPLRARSLDAALQDFRETLFRSDAAHFANEGATILTWLARLEAATGRETECHDHLTRARAELEQLGLDWGQYLIAHLTPRADARAAGKGIQLAIHPRERRSACDWIEAAIRLGHRKEAEAALAELERRSANDFPLAPPVLRGKALLAPDNELEVSFERAIESDEALPSMVFEAARTKLLFGERLRRADRRVRARSRSRPRCRCSSGCPRNPGRTGPAASSGQPQAGHAWTIPPGWWS